jgi:mannonate dehydratase
MRQTWRWFGPVDKVSIADARQAGAEGLVTALHHIPAGVAWSLEDIELRQRQCRAGGLEWEVVESVPISEAIKTSTGEWRAHLAAWQTSLANLAKAGIKTVCYNFMPVLDWTRTDLRWQTPTGARALRFDLVDFAVFDLHVLMREEAAADYPDHTVEAAHRRFRDSPESLRATLTSSVGAGLPGTADVYDLNGLRGLLAAYRNIDAAALRARLIDFLSEVAPVAQKLGMRLCCHPDDPPWPLLGLPRVMSTEADYRAVLDAVDIPANGMTLCTGSLGARSDNDLAGIVRRLGPRIHFAHLRSVKREDGTIPGSFHEDQHLEGDADIVTVVDALLAEERRRRAEGRADHEIPMRPDHGQDILDDLHRGAHPGYSAIGRLKGLAELRGVMRGLAYSAR